MIGTSVTLSVTNMTEEDLELDGGAMGAAPRQIRKHAAARFAATESDSVTFLIGGDPDRPVFIQIEDDSNGGATIDVWAPPVYEVEVLEAETGRVAVSLAPSRKRSRTETAA